MHRVIVVFVLAAVVMLAAFRFAGWYADNSALPRYCEKPLKTLHLVQRILTEKEPAGSGKRRDFIVAAKLIFLVPQQTDETTDDYIARLGGEISTRCSGQY